MIYLLLVLLLLLLAITYYVNKKEFIAPSFVYCFSFVFSVLWATLFYKTWQLETFHINTFIVVLGGALLFFISSLLVHFFFKKISIVKKNRVEFTNDSVYIKIDLFIKIVCIILLALTLFLSIKNLLKITGYQFSHIFEAMKRFDYLDKFSNESVSLGRITNLLRTISISLTFWYLYVFINNFIESKKVDFIGLVIIVLGIINTLVTGSRNYMITIVICGIAIFFMLLYRKNNNNSLVFSKKIIIIMVTIFIVSLTLFPKLTKLVGRNVSTSDYYYLAIYCGAPIKNLDTFLQSYNDTIKPEKQNITFRNLIVWYNSKFSNGEVYKFDQPFQNINGLNLGNVYTLYYSYIYDYGYAGMINLTILMAIIVQFIYEKSKRTCIKDKPNLWVLTYGYMFGYILLAYFNNKFYERVFTISFVQIILFWVVFNLIFTKIKIFDKKTGDIYGK